MVTGSGLFAVVFYAVIFVVVVRLVSVGWDRFQDWRFRRAIQLMLREK